MPPARRAMQYKRERVESRNSVVDYVAENGHPCAIAEDQIELYPMLAVIFSDTTHPSFKISRGLKEAVVDRVRRCLLVKPADGSREAREKLARQKKAMYMWASKFADVDIDVKNGANLLERLIKDVVTESESFDVERFIPLLQKYIRRSNPYIRQLLVGAIGTVEFCIVIGVLLRLDYSVRLSARYQYARLAA